MTFVRIGENRKICALIKNKSCVNEFQTSTNDEYDICCEIFKSVFIHNLQNIFN